MNHRKALVAISAFGIAMAVPALAAAQQPNSNCPPGSWFCADAQQQPAAPPGQPVQPLQPLPNPDAPPPAPKPAQPPVVYQPAPPPPVVVYQPPPPVMVVRPDVPPPAPYYYKPRDPYVRRNEWGLNLHIAGAMIGKASNVQRDTGMGGLGFGLRYKPVPAFGLQADLDFIGGTDYNGYKRTESAFSVNGLIFLNPRSKAQVYLLGGFGWSGARVTPDNNTHTAYAQIQQRYSYFGGQIGIGLELRLSTHFALNADLRGFMRGRTDSGAEYNPEFREPGTGRSTNTSGGGLFTAGMTFYF